MNREDLIKKLELARVGSGTQTYNDVVLTLTKEETLELLEYIEKLDKHNKNLCRLNAETLGESVEIHNENATLKLKLEQLEKELKQTKLNFKNSQTHSKNCYKKLKEKFEKLERAYKNNEVLVRDLNELINRNLELKKDYDLLDEDYDQLFAKFLGRKNENEKLKQAIKVLKDKFKLDVSLNIDGEFSVEVKIDKIQNIPNIVYLKYLEIEQYELLKQVFESVGDSDE